MDIVLRPGTPEDAAVCGPICFEAFKAIDDEHNFPWDFPSAEVATSLLTMRRAPADGRRPSPRERAAGRRGPAAAIRLSQSLVVSLHQARLRDPRDDIENERRTIGAQILRLRCASGRQRG